MPMCTGPGFNSLQDQTPHRLDSSTFSWILPRNLGRLSPVPSSVSLCLCISVSLFLFSTASPHRSLSFVLIFIHLFKAPGMHPFGPLLTRSRKNDRRVPDGLKAITTQHPTPPPVDNFASIPDSFYLNWTHLPGTWQAGCLFIIQTLHKAVVHGAGRI